MRITRKQAKSVLAVTFPEYKGRKITLRFESSITFSDTNWGGGTLNEYKFVRADGATAVLKVPAPWDNKMEGITLPIPEDILVVEHAFLCGQDMGIVIHTNPANAPRWLTAC